jgi:hypothetical protein
MIGDIDWRIYYDDGSTCNSAQGGPDDAPADGVVAIVQLSGRSREILKGWDCYFYHLQRKRWVGADAHTLHQRLKKRLPMAGVCDGIGMVTEDYQDLIAQGVVRDPDFPGAELQRDDAVEYLARAATCDPHDGHLAHATEIATRAGLSKEEIQGVLCDALQASG